VSPADDDAQAQAVRPRPAGEAHFRRIAEIVPEFAGFWYDSTGTLIINVTKPDAIPALRI
jgi:hypothetical protein